MATNSSFRDYTEEFKQVILKYNEAKGKADSDPEKRSEAKRYAQSAMGIAIKARDFYKELIVTTGKDAAAEKEMNVWNDRVKLLFEKLQGLGSTLSGIPTTSFDDVAGLEDVKTALKNYLFALKNPDLAKKYRIATNVGLLLYGPPGTGKTLVAEAIAHELGARFFVITPSNVFGSYVGESERNIRDIFAEVNSCEEGSVLLIDECESIFGRRTADSNRSSIGVANQLLQEMNGANGTDERRVIIGATNRPEMLDEAYLRYKRLSLHFYIGMPNDEARNIVVDHKLGRLPHDKSAIQYLKDMLTAKELEGHPLTCADISNVIEQCASKAMEEMRIKLERNPADTSEINIGISHINAVLQNFAPSVSPELLEQYEQFKREREGKK